ncbi:Transposase and inactivated derivatives, TnpA family [Actinopolyspora xinjiangensis]|uniref:Transposase and inactivated derivatives, TnpA family n=1 Tax=Actinopolyspora xinjiangensis TaxID=405564 RepID=A0A1H0RG52_9ACTN|nr:Tn3 family transposase [Actinopolyspora xinjiangensis]SDP28543.1 Transposase and inactivated derivatives, TnpA family [Actinopolyspora xinjiangensis]
MSTRFFSDEEIERLRSWPAELGRDELIRYFTLGSDDRAWLERSARGQGNRLGLAVQLCTLPWLGFVPDEVPAAPRAAVNRLAVQLGVGLVELAGYGAREQTRTEHLRLVTERLGWRLARDAEWKDLEEFLAARAMEHDAPSVLFRLVCEYCAGARIIRPGVVPLMRAVATARERATAETFLLLEPLLGAQRREELDALLVAGGDLRISRLAWLHRGATTASPMAIRAELDKLRFLRGLDAHTLDLSMLPEARRRRLAGIGRRSTNQALARRDGDKRYPVLLATVAECAVEVLDEVIGMFDQALSGVENRAKRKLDDLLAQRARESEDRLNLLEEILAVATDVDVPDAEVGPRLRRGIGLERLRTARRDPADRLPRDHGHLAMVESSFTYLREFVPHVIRAVSFEAAVDARPLLEAVEVLAELYARGGRKVPEGAPTEFVPSRWRGYLDQAATSGNTTAYRHYWELATLLGLRDALRSGDVWVPGSRRFADPTTFLLPARRWEALRGEYCALVGAPQEVDEALENAGEQLHAALGELEPLLAAGDGPVRLTERGELVVNRLSAEAVPDEVERLRGQLLALLPRPQLTELLIEVDRWADWSEQLTHAGGKTHRQPQLRRNLYAAILAQACNFGVTAMSEASGISEETLRWTTEWYLREDTLRAANAAIVNHHHRLPLASVWGAGTMSSSDGQRFPMRGKSLTARAMSRYFVNEGVATYTHVSDQHSTFGTKVIPVTDREAVYVLDEILGNATDLPITEHATDTAGQTLTVFALFALTGFTLSPRIRDLGGITLHRLGTRKQVVGGFPHAGTLLTGTIDTALIRSQWDEMLRLAASLKYGHATASLVVSKLHASSRRSALAQALVEYGKLQRTIYALRYLADEAYRRRITRQLNKGESLHSLRRDLFFAHDGTMRRRHQEQQTEQALCLSLVTNAIITWNTAYRPLRTLEAEG